MGNVAMRQACEAALSAVTQEAIESGYVATIEQGVDMANKHATEADLDFKVRTLKTKATQIAGWVVIEQSRNNGTLTEEGERSLLALRGLWESQLLAEATEYSFTAHQLRDLLECMKS